MLPDYDKWLSTLPDPEVERNLDDDDRDYENALEDKWESKDETI